MTVMRKRNMDTHIPAIMESSSACRGFPWLERPTCNAGRETEGQELDGLLPFYTWSN